MENLPSKKFSKEQFEVLKTFLTKHGFSSTSFSKKVSYGINRSSGQEAKFSKTPSFNWPRLKGASEEKIKEINVELEELKKTNKIFEKFTIRTTVDVGDQFEPVADITKVFGDDNEKVIVDRIEGQVLLVDFWATW